MVDSVQTWLLDIFLSCLIFVIFMVDRFRPLGRGRGVQGSGFRLECEELAVDLGGCPAPREGQVLLRLHSQQRQDLCYDRVGGRF